MPLGYFQVFFGEKKATSMEVLGIDPVSAQLSRQRRKISSLKVDWDGVPDLALLDNPLLEENVLLHWRFMLDNGQTKTGAHIVKKFGRTYPDDNSTKVTLEAFDRRVILKEMPSTEVFIDFKASDLALVAAERLGLTPNIVESKVVYGTVSLAGQTFGEVLTKMADDEDFEFFILNGTEFVFAPAPDEPDKVKEFSYSAGGFRSDILGTHLKNFKVVREAVARVGGEKRKVRSVKEDGTTDESSGLLDGVFSGVEDRVKATYQNGGGNIIEAELTPEQTAAILQSQQINHNAIVATIVESSPNRGNRYSNARNNSGAKFIRWRGYKASGNLVGGFLEPRDFVRIKGVVGRDAGPWLVEKVITKWAAGDIEVAFSGIAEPKKRTKGKGSDKEGKADKTEALPDAEKLVNVEYLDGGGNASGDESRAEAVARTIAQDAAGALQ